MPTFPKREPDVVALAEAMVAGYTAHPTDFPSVTVATLTTALTNYKNQRTTKENAESQAQIATVTKDEKLDTLVEMMKNDLKVSEVDTTADPEKLYEIGWGPRSQPTPIAAARKPDRASSDSRRTRHALACMDKTGNRFGRAGEKLHHRKTRPAAG